MIPETVTADLTRSTLAAAAAAAAAADVCVMVPVVVDARRTATCSPRSADDSAATAMKTSEFSVAVLAFDIVGFTALSAAIGPEEVVKMLDRCASVF